MADIEQQQSPTEVHDRRIALTTARAQAEIEVAGNFKKATTVAGMCKAIVISTAVQIQGNRYVPAASWEAIAAAHGCVVSTSDVKWVPAEGEGEHRMAGGFMCKAELRNAATGVVVATAEGFVGEDEPVWFGGEATFWDKRQNKNVTKKYQKRHDSAIRAMVQTRAAGRVCKQVFAHVVVLMDANLSTTPLEEVSDPDSPESQPDSGLDPNMPPPLPIFDWRDVRIHFGKKHGPGRPDPENPEGPPLPGKQLGELSDSTLKWYQDNFVVKTWNGKIHPDDFRLRRALDISMGKAKPDPRPEEKQATATVVEDQSANAPD